MPRKAIYACLGLLFLAGCATSTRYFEYTYHSFPAKDSNFAVNVYPPAQSGAAAKPYFVIGKVSIEGFASNGVSPEKLTNDAVLVARRKGADAIINAKTVALRYYDGDTLLRFTGDLILNAERVQGLPSVK